MTENVHEEIAAVWERHDDEAYRQDQSHWRGVRRWGDENWLRYGRTTLTRVKDLYHTARRVPPVERSLVTLEWGPGGGANLHALAEVSALMYGVDISAKNLGESQRIVDGCDGARFVPIHLTEEPRSVVSEVVQPIDLFVSTAVFQHFPSREYGREVLKTVSSLMSPDGLGYVQIRFDNGNPKYAPKPVSTYRDTHITANSYELSDFWDALVEAGLRPLKIAHIATANNYASFFFEKLAGK